VIFNRRRLPPKNPPPQIPATQKPTAAADQCRHCPKTPRRCTKQNLRHKLCILCASSSSGCNDHDNLDHSYIMTGYLDINIKNNVYSN
jgi:hypothetical protein